MSRACSRHERIPGSGARVAAPRRALLLHPRHLAYIEKHARAAYPAECCGILVGAAGEPIRVSSVHRATNQRAETVRDRYEIDPREMLALDRAAVGQGREIVGFYHSHPDHPPAPSATDAASAWPGYVYLIVAVNGGGQAAKPCGPPQRSSDSSAIPRLCLPVGEATPSPEGLGWATPSQRDLATEITAWTYDDREGRFDELAIRPATKPARRPRAHHNEEVR